ncbi:MFS general substrate transporter [Aspergillus lentulus]|nr:MFS general substrate transporter [Aspergillus lentulus]
MQLEKNDYSSQAITASSPGHDSKHPSIDFSQKTPSENDPANDKPVNTDPEEAPPARREVEPAPDGGYGWVCVLCVFLVNAHTWEINSSYGIFLAHYLDTNTFPDASDPDFAFIGGLSLSMAQFTAPVATITTRKWGTRTTLTIGIILQSAALLGASWATEIWRLFLSQALCFGFGMGMQFSGTRAGLCGPSFSHPQLRKHWAIFNLGGGLGRPAIGYASNSFGPLNTAAACTFLAGLFSLVIWIFAKSFGVLIFYALVGRVVAPTFTTTVAPVAVEVVGLQVLPSALSILRLSVVMPSTFAEPNQFSACPDIY